jgi:hypothetical protein
MKYKIAYSSLLKLLLFTCVSIGCGEEEAPPVINVELLEPLTTSTPARVSTFMRLDINGEPVAGLEGDAFTFLENEKKVSSSEARPKVIPDP